VASSVFSLMLETHHGSFLREKYSESIFRCWNGGARLPCSELFTSFRQCAKVAILEEP
jgi:hypothetical protein